MLVTRKPETTSYFLNNKRQYYLSDTTMRRMPTDELISSSEADGFDVVKPIVHQLVAAAR